ncbi:MAG TPA: CoA ester lyase [Paenalcaligenes sp.]|nr:CoA ester lyase [Paenalcaligenes sp.]
MASIRSFLFVPASRVDRFEKALDTQADAVIIDLEDAVAIDAKAVARDALCDWLEEQSTEDESLLKRIWVRINPLNSPWGHDDMDALSEFHLGGWVVPKAENTYDVEQVVTLKPKRTQLALLIETAVGLAHARLLSTLDGVDRLMFGTLDFQLDLDMKCDPLETQLNAFRAELTLASRLAGLEAPVDGVTPSTTDTVLLEQSVQQARAYGFGAKLCIHPRQVEGVNRGFMPSAAEHDWAQRVIEANKKHQGAAFSVDGKMVDAPVIALAEQIIQQYQRD